MYPQEVFCRILERRFAEPSRKVFRYDDCIKYHNILQRIRRKSVRYDTCETVTETGELLEDVSATGRKRPWKEHKIGSMQLADLFRVARKYGQSISDSRLRALEECADELWFLQDAEGKRRLKSANFCRVRVCPM